MCGYSWKNYSIALMWEHHQNEKQKLTNKKNLRESKLEVKQYVNMSLKDLFGLYRVKCYACMSAWSSCTLCADTHKSIFHEPGIYRGN